MAARRKQRSDLVERVRYPNPLPELPYAPKLVHIPAPQPNYASPVYAQRIAESQQLPVVVDAEAGMPLDLARMESLWLADGRDAVTTSYPLDETQLHDDDAFLLSDDLAARAPGVIEGAQPAPAQPADVTWLRRTEYLGAEQRKQRQAERSTRAPPLDTSRDAQIARIQEGFAAANVPLAELRHPSKPGVHAVDAYELLPDPETWATPMHVVRFTTALGRADVEDDVRMDTAVLRPYSDATGQRVSLYLTSGETLPPYDDGTGEAPDPQAAADADAQVPDAERVRRQDIGALRYLKRRRLGVYPEGPHADTAPVDANEAATAFRHVRDLEPLDQLASLGNQLVLVLDDGHPDAAPELASITTSGTVAAQAARRDEAAADDTDALFDADEAPAQTESDVSTTLPPQTDVDRVRQRAVPPLSLGRKVAYYHPIDMRYSLQIRRQRKAEMHRAVPYDDFWHRVALGNRAATERERARRMHARAQVDQLDLDGVELEESEDEEAEVEEAHEAQDAHDVPASLRHGDASDERNDDEHDQGAVEEDMDHVTSPAGARHDERAADRDADAAHAAGVQVGFDAVAAGDTPMAAAQKEGQAVMNAAAQSTTTAGADPKWDALHGDEHDEERGAASDATGASDAASDATDSDASEIDADAELAALREEAQGAGDDVPAEGGRRSRRRDTAA
ncbi:hypothetical protein MBRA1_001302 [Malassezia brasiliensis]|uniref:RNA polymerase II-associated protein 1 n=1 Tax=Malassezia brasiliensis TaxID=1821822 RepID=A0AAF0IS78_9BASI|nr:hypothetical protein MBRA1_001302 [Malassezia brasiliensis]